MRKSQIIFGILFGLAVIFATMQLMNLASTGAIPTGGGRNDISLPR